MEAVDHDLIIKYISTLGFPIVAAIALFFALKSLGSYLIKSHTNYLEENTKEMKAQTAALKSIDTQLPKICQASCPGINPQNNSRPSFKGK